jgi:hypothetical protein
MISSIGPLCRPAAGPILDGPAAVQLAPLDEVRALATPPPEATPAPNPHHTTPRHYSVNNGGLDAQPLGAGRGWRHRRDTTRTPASELRWKGRRDENGEGGGCRAQPTSIRTGEV